MVNILEKDHPVLREKAREIPKEKIGSREIKKIIEEMKEALHSQEDGVAIAAPQIGHSVRLFVVAGKVKSIIKGEDHTESKYEDTVYINPRITKRSKEKELMEEGCLSARWLYGKVNRHKKVIIEALDENGKEVKKGGSGLMAQIYQHETDHLDGILFLDTATDIESIPPEHIEKI